MKHVKSLLSITSVFSFVLLAGTALSPVHAKTLWLEEDDFRSSLAQGDAEEVPAEFLLTEEEMKLQTQDLKQAAGTVQKENADEEKIPTLTAEGGFLLPTYVLPETKNETEAKTLAVVDQNNPWRAQTAQAVPTPASRTVAAAAQPVALQGLPASGVQDASAVDTKLLDTIEKQYQNTTALLADTAKRLEALENGVNTLKEQNVQLASAEKVATPEPVRRQPLLLPLAPVKAATPVAKSEPAENTDMEPPKVEYIDYVLTVLKRVEGQPVAYSESDEMVLKSIPQEMKMSFLPNSADISTQSFKWIKAFTYHPKKSLQNIVEVRMSAKDLDLQSRRFALIKGALLSNGLSPRQIRFVLTDRDPDTIVLRNVTLQPEQEVYYERQNNGSLAPQIIQKW